MSPNVHCFICPPEDAENELENINDAIHTFITELFFKYKVYVLQIDLLNKIGSVIRIYSSY